MKYNHVGVYINFDSPYMVFECDSTWSEAGYQPRVSAEMLHVLYDMRLFITMRLFGIALTLHDLEQEPLATFRLVENLL